jgi:hypothetical protein
LKMPVKRKRPSKFRSFEKAICLYMFLYPQARPRLMRAGVASIMIPARSDLSFIGRPGRGPPGSLQISKPATGAPCKKNFREYQRGISGTRGRGINSDYRTRNQGGAANERRNRINISQKKSGPGSTGTAQKPKHYRRSATAAIFYHAAGLDATQEETAWTEPQQSRKFGGTTIAGSSWTSQRAAFIAARIAAAGQASTQPGH